MQKYSVKVQNKPTKTISAYFSNAFISDLGKVFAKGQIFA